MAEINQSFVKIPYSELSAAQKLQMEKAGAQGGGKYPIVPMSGEEYYNSRGGMNKAGYWGDSYTPGLTLTDEEYAAAIASTPKGGLTGSSISAASQKKAMEYYSSLGYSADQISKLIGGSARLVDGRYYDVGNLLGNTPQITDEKTRQGQSAYTLLLEQFNQYGLGALIEPLKGFIVEGLSPAEFTLRLRETDAYKKRFAANAQRVAKGLRALSEAEYIGLEDQYQDVMRRYGLPESYYTRGDMGRQEGFEKFIAGDVSPVELEDRVQTAQRRVLNAAPQIKDTLTQYYGDEISNGDILAYVLDPTKAIENIKRKVTAAEIGGAAARFGLGATRTRAEELGTYGVTGEQAQAGYEMIGGGLERGRQLSAIYGGPAYTQAVAETELFKLPTATEARKQRQQLIKQETATFGGTAGATGGALARDRAGAF
jgi:hypothetical protein